MHRTAIIVVAAATALSACGELSYTPPVSAGGAEDVVTATVGAGGDEVWARSTAELGRLYFVIDSKDEAAGVVNLRNRGADPLGYIDCGHIRSRVRNVYGDRTYSFSAANAEMQYEIMTDDILRAVTRRMALDARATVVFEDAGPDAVRITVKTRYRVTRTEWISGVDGSREMSTDTIGFGTGGGARFPDGTVCVATGEMERSILKLIR